MNALYLITLLFAGAFIYRVEGFDYSPPILQSNQEVVLDFDSGGCVFYYNIFSELNDPFGLWWHRVSLALVGEAGGRVLQFKPNQVSFLDGEAVSVSSEEYKRVGGGNRLGMGGYDATPDVDGWFYHDYFEGSLLDWWRQLKVVLIGLRFQLDDGVHHGWIRFSRADTHFTTVFQPTEYDWNPIPDAPIGAGQPPVIPITTEVTDQGLHLSWPPILATWTLESTGVLSDGAVWVPVPEAIGYETYLNFPDASCYFRLKKPVQ